MIVQAVHKFFKQGDPLPKLATTTVTDSGFSNYNGEPMSVIKVCYESKGQKRKRDGLQTHQGGGRGGGRGSKDGMSTGAKGVKSGGQWGQEWPGHTKKYCRFALGKCNMDTQVR